MGWIRGTAGNGTGEYRFPESGLITTSLPPSPTHQTSPQSQEPAAGGERSPALHSPRCPRWQFAVQHSSRMCRSGVFRDGHGRNQEKEPLVKICRVLCLLGAAQLCILSSWVYSAESSECPSCRRAWRLTGQVEAGAFLCLLPSRTYSLCPGLGREIQSRRGGRAGEGVKERGKETKKRKWKAEEGPAVKALQAPGPPRKEAPSHIVSNTLQSYTQYRLLIIIYQFPSAAVCWLTMLWFCSYLVKHLIILILHFPSSSSGVHIFFFPGPWNVCKT